MSEILSKYKDKFKVFTHEENEYNVTFFATEVETKKDVYLKVYDKRLLEEGPKDLLMKQIQREKELTQLCKSENIIELYEVLDTDISIIFVYEAYYEDLAEYLSLYDRLMEKKNFFIKIVRSMANALKVLSKNKVIHRDIKPNNIYIPKKDYKSNDIEENNIIKLGNFNSSIKIEENDNLQIGTLAYLPPEIKNNLEYDEKCDLWSLGITLYHLYFGNTPYGLEYDIDSIQDTIYQFSNIPTLDILFRKLLEIDPKKRMTHDELYEYVFSKDFMKPDVVYKEEIYGNIYTEIKNIMNTNEYKNLNIEKKLKNESYNMIENKFSCIKKIVETADAFNIIYAKKKKDEKSNIKIKYNNIIYYNEDIKHPKNLSKEINIFEENTSGTFFFINNMDSLELINIEILNMYKIDKRYMFNIIMPGSISETIINFLIKKGYDQCYKYICLFCMNVNAYLPLKNKYNKIDGIYRTKKKIIEEFINKYKDENIKPFPVIKFITYEEYKKKYFRSHKKIAEFYGYSTKEEYLKNMNKIKNLIHKDEKELCKKENILLKSFQSFDFQDDIEKVTNKLINEYTKNTFFGDLNRWLRNINQYSYEEVAYFTSRFMYILNLYAQENKKYYNENKTTIYRGTKMNLSSLLAYERAKAKGDIIILTSFTSTTLEKNRALKFANRKKKEYEFSVLYYITNLYNENWISNGVDIHDISKYKKEKEILFHPFSFYILLDVKYDIKNFTAEIYLQTIGKKEILEKSLQNGKYIEYNKDLNIIESVSTFPE